MLKSQGPENWSRGRPGPIKSPAPEGALGALGSLGACGRLPKARRGRVFIVQYNNNSAPGGGVFKSSAIAERHVRISIKIRVGGFLLCNTTTTCVRIAIRVLSGEIQKKEATGVRAAIFLA